MIDATEMQRMNDQCNEMAKLRHIRRMIDATELQCMNGALTAVKPRSRGPARPSLSLPARHLEARVKQKSKTPDLRAESRASSSLPPNSAPTEEVATSCKVPDPEPVGLGATGLETNHTIGQYMGLIEKCSKLGCDGLRSNDDSDMESTCSRASTERESADSDGAKGTSADLELTTSLHNR